MPKSTYLRNKIIDIILRNTAWTPPATVYVSLHSADPGLTGASEIAGGSYARTAVTFTAPSSGATENSGTITFPTPSADWGAVTHFGIFDAASSGNFLYGAALTVSRTILNGDTPKFNAGDIDLTEA